MESIYAFWLAFWDSLAGRSGTESDAGTAGSLDPQQTRKRLFDLWINTAPGTNSLRGGIVVPMGFEPPPVAPPLQSSATYSTP